MLRDINQMIAVRNENLNFLFALRLTLYKLCARAVLVRVCSLSGGCAVSVEGVQSKLWCAALANHIIISLSEGVQS